MENETVFYLVCFVTIFSLGLTVLIQRKKFEKLTNNHQALRTVLDYIEFSDWEIREKGFWHVHDGIFVSLKDKEYYSIQYNGEECYRPTGDIKHYSDKLQHQLSHLKYDDTDRIEIQKLFSSAAVEKISKLITPIMSIENPHLPNMRDIVPKEFADRINRTEINNLFEVIGLYHTYGLPSDNPTFVEKLNNTIPTIFENLETYYGISGWKTGSTSNLDTSYLNRFKETIESIPYLSDEVRNPLLKKVAIAIEEDEKLPF